MGQPELRLCSAQSALQTPPTLLFFIYSTNVSQTLWNTKAILTQSFAHRAYNLTKEMANTPYQILNDACNGQGLIRCPGTTTVSGAP